MRIIIKLISLYLFTTLIDGLFAHRYISISEDKSDNIRTTSQAKRDLSLSYAATDIDSKEGTRVKTITVIKNRDKKNERLAINPELHKNEEWATAFRDNFDSYGSIPDVPDIDDLFEFVNKKKSILPRTKVGGGGGNGGNSSGTRNGNDKGNDSGNDNGNGNGNGSGNDNGNGNGNVNKKDNKPDIKKPKDSSEEVDEKPIVEASAEVKSTIPKVDDEGSVEKIKGDAEIVPGLRGRNHNNNNNNVRSQSLSLTNKHHGGTFERLVNVNYSSPQHSVHQFFDNYVQRDQNGYDYSRPCLQQGGPVNSIPVTTPSGRTYDLPVANNNGVVNPYIAPAVVKKPPAAPQSPSLTSPPSTSSSTSPAQFPANNPQIFPVVQPTYSVNSIVPPLQSSSVQVNGGGGPVGGGIGNGPAVPSLQQQPALLPPLQSTNSGSVSNGIQNSYSTSQRPYVAPQLRNVQNNNRGSTVVPISRNNPATNFRTSVYAPGANRLNNARSRGLKY